MKLLLETNDPNEIRDIKLQLESNGIPIFIGNENTARNFQYLGADAKQTLWVFVKAQYEDALALLNNSEHEVKNKVDVKKFYEDLDKNNHRGGPLSLNNSIRFIIDMTAVGYSC